MTSAAEFVLGLTGIPADLQSDICAKMAENVDIWDGADEVEWLFHTHLTGIDWRWQWFDDWHLMFTDFGAFPRMWGYTSRWKGRAERDFGRYDHRIFLLAHTASFVHYDFLRLENSKIRDLCYFSPIDDEPLDVQDIVLGMIDNYMGQGEPLLPPYFPGDRTDWRFAVVQLTRPPRPFTCQFRPDSKWAIGA